MADPKVPLKEIKDRLNDLGIKSTTPGLTGEGRYEELESRLQNALMKIERHRIGGSGCSAYESRPSSSASEDRRNSGHSNGNNDSSSSLVNLSIGELRYRLSSLGESSSTPGLVGDERRAELMKRLVAALCLRDDTDDTEMLLPDSILQSVATTIDPPRPDYLNDPEPQQPPSSLAHVPTGNNRRPPAPEEPHVEIVDNTSALQNEISELKREAKRLANKRSMAIASRLSGPTQDPKLKEEDKFLGKVEAELARLRIQKQSSSSAITASSMLIDNGKMMSIEKLFGKFDVMKNEVKAEIKFHRNKIRDEESENTEYGVQCEEDVNNKVKNFSYEKSRTRRKIEEIKTIGKKKNLLTKLNNKITNTNNRDEEFDKKFSILEQKSELNKFEFEDLLADLDMDEKSGLFDKKDRGSKQKSTTSTNSAASNRGKRPLPPADPHPDDHETVPSFNAAKKPSPDPSAQAKVGSPMVSIDFSSSNLNGLATSDMIYMKGADDTSFYDLMKNEITGAAKVQAEGGFLKEQYEDNNKMAIGTSILRKGSGSKQTFLFDNTLYDNRAVASDDDDDDDDDDDGHVESEMMMTEEARRAVGRLAPAVGLGAARSTDSDSDDDDDDDVVVVKDVIQSSRQSNHLDSEDDNDDDDDDDDNNDAESDHEVVPPPLLNNSKVSTNVKSESKIESDDEDEDEEEEEEEERAPFPAKDSFATNKFLRRLIEKESNPNPPSSNTKSESAPSNIVSRRNVSSFTGANTKTPPQPLRPPPPLSLGSTVETDADTSAANLGGLLSGDDSDYDNLDDDDLDDMDAEEISLQVKTLSRHAEVLLRSGDIASAEALYERALELDPVHVEVLYKFARLLHNRRGNIQRAESLYARAVQMSIPHLYFELVSPSKVRTSSTISPSSTCTPASPNTHVDEKKLAATGKRGTKLRVVVSLLLNYANFAKRAKADINVAHILYKKALELAPDSAKVLGDVAHFLSEEGFEVSLAIELFARCIRVNPSNVLNTMRYAKLLKKVGKYNEAELLYKVSVVKSLDDKKMEPTAHCNYATFLCKVRKNMNMSYENFKVGLEKYPSHKGLLKNFDIFLRSNPDFIYEGSPNPRALITRTRNPLSEKERLRIDTEIKSFNESQATNLNSPKTVDFASPKAISRK